MSNKAKYIITILAALIALLVPAYLFGFIGRRRKVNLKNQHIDDVIEQYINACETTFGKLSDQQLASIYALVESFATFGDNDGRKLAYIIASCYHESRLTPIKEYRAAKNTSLRAIQDRYWSTGYYGRGLIQITWRENYAKFSDLVGVDLEKYPDAALDTEIAAPIAVIGMMNGMFTGKSLDTYINEIRADYYNARKIVNPGDYDTYALIEGYTVDLLNMLT